MKMSNSRLLRQVLYGDDHELVGHTVDCPGCATFGFKYFPATHTFYIRPFGNGENAVWQFDGNIEYPTFSPSLIGSSHHWVNEEWVPWTCHFFLENGIFKFLNDCTHKLAGQHVAMREVHHSNR